jgi:peptidoglycan hydrolase-like protein with peptidoglycan-binding domain
MRKQTMKAMQDRPDIGRLRCNVVSSLRETPIENARIEIAYSGDPDSSVEALNTDNSGITEVIELAAPPIDYSLAPSENQPYSEYTLKVTAEGYKSLTVTGSEVLAEVTSLQQIRLRPVQPNQIQDAVIIPAHTLYGDYPPKIAEAEIKPVSETGEIVLSKVVVPELVVVHDGSPRDSTATDYYVKYKDYIKNVASSEIYATWPESTIYANVLAIMSFTLNRVYTEWYRNKGFNFTISSSTAFDHKWMNGRNIYENISQIVDTVFTNYLSRPNVKQPILTQYCDGEKVSCPNWMTQWGSKNLGDQGMSAIEILRNFYGDNMYINSAEEVAGIPSSWPGENLTVGSIGDKVTQMQEQLNTIADTYSAIPRIPVDGNFGENTADAVKQFQKVFSLPQTGIVDYPTWYKIQEIYVGVTRIAELS